MAVTSANTTANYLIKKKTLEDCIYWYSKTVDDVEKQQLKRKQTLSELQEQLYKLERDYYGA